MDNLTLRIARQLQPRRLRTGTMARKTWTVRSLMMMSQTFLRFRGTKPSLNLRNLKPKLKPKRIFRAAW